MLKKKFCTTIQSQIFKTPLMSTYITYLVKMCNQNVLYREVWTASWASIIQDFNT